MADELYFETPDGRFLTYDEVDWDRYSSPEYAAYKTQQLIADEPRGPSRREFTQDLTSYAQYDPSRPSQEGFSPWADEVMGKALANVGSGFAGGIQAVGDLFGSETLSDFGKDTKARADWLRAGLQAKYNRKPEGLTAASTEIGAPAATVGLIAANPPLGMLALASNYFGNAYGNYDEEAGTGRKFAGAAGTTALNVATDYLTFGASKTPVGAPIKKVALDTGKRILRDTLFGTAINPTVEVGNALTEDWVNRDETDWGEIGQRAKQAAQNTLVMAPVVSAGLHGTAGIKRIKSNNLGQIDNLAKNLDEIAGEQQAALPGREERLASPEPEIRPEDIVKLDGVIEELPLGTRHSAEATLIEGKPKPKAEPPIIKVDQTKTFDDPRIQVEQAIRGRTAEHQTALKDLQREAEVAGWLKQVNSVGAPKEAQEVFVPGPQPKPDAQIIQPESVGGGARPQDAPKVGIAKPRTEMGYSEQYLSFIERYKQTSESGAIATKDSIVGNFLNDARDYILHAVQPGGPKTYGEYGTRAEQPIGSRFFDGMVDVKFDKMLNDPQYEVRIPGLSPVLGQVRTWITKFDTIAQKVPYARHAWKIADMNTRISSSKLFDAVQQLSSYGELQAPSKLKVNQYLIAARINAANGKKVTESIQTLTDPRVGLLPEEAKAVLAVRQFFDNSLEMIRQGLLADPPAAVRGNIAKMKAFKNKVNQTVDEMRDSRYVPFIRKGKYFVYAPTYDNGKGYLSFHDDLASYKNVQDSFNADGIPFRYGEVGKNTHEAYDGLPSDILFRFWEDTDGVRLDDGFDIALDEKYAFKKRSKNTLDSQFEDFRKKSEDVHRQTAYQPQGFYKHLIKPKLVAGFDTDLEMAMTDYARSISFWYANKVTKQPYIKALEYIARKEGGRSKTAQVFDALRREMWEDGAKMKAVRKYMAAWFLSRPITAAVNAMQPLVTGTPTMLRQEWGLNAKQASRLTVRSYRDYFNMQRDGNAFQAKEPELYADVMKARRQGIVDDANVREFIGRRVKPGKNGPTAQLSVPETLLFLQSTAEVLNKNHAFISAWRMATDNGLTGAARYEAAVKFTNETQFNLRAPYRNRISLGYGGVPLMFKLFNANLFRLMRNNLPAGNRKALLGQVGALMLLGGYKTLPFVNEARQAAKASGADPEFELRRMLNEMLGDGVVSQKFIETFMRGVPAATTGIDISGNVAMQELAPGLEQGPEAAIARSVAGVSLDPVQRVGRAASLFREGRNLDAAGQLLPPWGRSMLEAGRWAATGQVEDQRGNILFKDPTPYEIAVRGVLGANPTRFSREKERAHSATVANIQSRDNRNINQRIANLMRDGKPEEARQLYQEAKAKGLYPNVDTIRQMMLDWKTRAAKRTPKRPEDLERMKQILTLP